MKIKDRIRKHYVLGIDYHTLMGLVFPIEDYPGAWRCSMNGGPPGCAMAFGRALRQMGGARGRDDIVWLPSKRKEEA